MLLSAASALCTRSAVSYRPVAVRSSCAESSSTRRAAEHRDSQRRAMHMFRELNHRSRLRCAPAVSGSLTNESVAGAYNFYYRCFDRNRGSRPSAGSLHGPDQNLKVTPVENPSSCTAQVVGQAWEVCDTVFVTSWQSVLIREAARCHSEHCILTVSAASMYHVSCLSSFVSQDTCTFG